MIGLGSDKNLRGHRCTYRVPKYPKLTVRPIAFRVYDSIFLRRYTEIGKKENFFDATLCTQKFTTRNFLGLASTEPLRTQDSENLLT